MPKKNTFTKLFSDTSKKDINEVGGKGANLGEMTQAGLPVPPGFTVTSSAFQHFLKEAKLVPVIKNILKDLDREDSKKLQSVSANIKKAIVAAPMPSDVKKEVELAYKKLSKGSDAFVAVRSSATAEDLPGASFAGQQETYLDVRGIDDVMTSIQNAWASLFESRAIFYREEQGFDHFKVSIAIPVQKMVQSEVSGVMFTIDPLTNDRDKVAIEAIFGLGDALVGGQITPDQYIVSKASWEIVSKHMIKQTTMLGYTATSEEEQVASVPVSKEYQEAQKLSDEDIIVLAKIGKSVEDHYGFPQDIEWAREGGEFFLVQTRPVTTIDVDESDGVMAVPVPNEQVPFKDIDLPVILSGLAASPGVGVGPVKVIHSAKEINKVKEGEILVTEMTTPDFVPAMRRAVAIVTDEGGRTSHAAIVSRELGIPAVVGTQEATKMLKTDEVITVDGLEGNLYEGDQGEQLRSFHTQKEQSETQTQTVSPLRPLPTKTATKVYVNLGEPDLAEEMAERDVDGVGLLRAEFMMAQIGTHPRYALDHGKREEYIDQLHDGLLSFSKAFDPRPVVYRTSDFRTNEYMNLKGSSDYETDEENPMIGFRGVARYLADPEVLSMELEAIKKVRRYHKNLHVMLPFVRTPDELKKAKKILADHDLHRGASFKLWIMVEVPSTVILLDQFIGVGIDGISIGSNDLTQLLLGVDRDNAKLGNVFDERNDAVLWAMKRVVTICHEHGITASICGQAPSVYPEITRELVKAGVTSVSVSPDMIDKTRQIVAQAEADLVLMR